MTVSEQTLTRIQSLARLYQIGYRSNTVDATIEKLMAMERSRLETEIDNLASHLRSFERRYHLSSQEFYRRFQAGEMGDEADMFEWSAFYQMWLSDRERLAALHAEKMVWQHKITWTFGGREQARSRAVERDISANPDTHPTE